MNIEKITNLLQRVLYCAFKAQEVHCIRSDFFINTNPNDDNENDECTYDFSYKNLQDIQDIQDTVGGFLFNEENKSNIFSIKCIYDFDEKCTLEINTIQNKVVSFNSLRITFWFKNYFPEGCLQNSFLSNINNYIQIEQLSNSIVDLQNPNYSKYNWLYSDNTNTVELPLTDEDKYFMLSLKYNLPQREELLELGDILRSTLDDYNENVPELRSSLKVENVSIQIKEMFNPLITKENIKAIIDLLYQIQAKQNDIFLLNYSR